MIRYFAYISPHNIYSVEIGLSLVEFICVFRMLYVMFRIEKCKREVAPILNAHLISFRISKKLSNSLKSKFHGKFIFINCQHFIWKPAFRNNFSAEIDKFSTTQTRIVNLNLIKKFCSMYHVLCLLYSVSRKLFLNLIHEVHNF